jgi:cytochrome c553
VSPSLALLLTLCAGAAAAVDEVDSLCIDCHRPAQSRGAVPVIEGQHADYLRAQLERFQHRHREGFPMNALSAGLQPEQIETLVQQLSSREWRPAQPATEADVSAGRERLDTLDCSGCHGAGFLGGGSIPRLAGQQTAYLERQILGFGDAERHHPPVGGGVRMYSLDAEDAAAIALALSEMR